MIKTYIRLAKPGIIIGNLISASGGFLFASRGDVQWALLAATLLGTMLIIASGCVFNNYIDRTIDAKMPRTKGRALVMGSIPTLYALAYGTLLGLTGFTVLTIFTNR